MRAIDIASLSPSPPKAEPLAVSPAEAARLAGLGRTSICTALERYLISRGIVLDELSAEVRANLRYHLGCPHPRDDAGDFVPPLPAMLALVEHSERGPMAIHATYLRPDGSGKAAIANPKAMFGPIGGGAVRFGMPCSGGMARNRRGHRDRACGSYRVRAAGMGSTFGRRYPRARAAARGDPPPDLCWS
jgi:hypothetical protein